MKPGQIVAGACIGFVAMTLVALGTRGIIMPLLKPHTQAEALFSFTLFQAISAVIAAGLAWIVSLIVPRAVAVRAAALVLCGYVLGIVFIYANDRAAAAIPGKLSPLVARLIVPVLLAVISLVVISRRKPARRA